MGDNTLLQEFVASRSEAAFAALVRQHMNLVFATAYRQLGQHSLAEEVSQSVFVALARKAGSLGRHPTVAGWLHKATLLECRRVLRTELRRQRHEHVAIALGTVSAAGDSVWASLVPLLDEALLQLNEKDRLAVLLRFLEEKPLREVGQALGASEDAAQKRVARALSQMTDFFRQRGFAVPALTASAPLFAAATHAAPAGLADTVVTASLSGVTGTATTALALNFLKLISMTKLKTAVIAGVVLLLTASGILHIVNSRHDVVAAKQPAQEELTKATGSRQTTASAFWRRVQILHQSRADASAADDALREKLARLKALLYAPPTKGGPRSDAAYNLMQSIPLEQRAAALDMVTQALSGSEL